MKNPLLFLHLVCSLCFFNACGSGPAARIIPPTPPTLRPSQFGFRCSPPAPGQQNCTDPYDAVLTNTGTSTMYIQAITIPSGALFSQTNNCPTSLLVGQSCAITVSFFARDEWSGTVNYSSVLSVYDNLPGSPQQVGLEGTAAAE